jgi:hypothetical protein
MYQQKERGQGSRFPEGGGRFGEGRGQGQGPPPGFRGGDGRGRRGNHPNFHHPSNFHPPGPPGPPDPQMQAIDPMQRYAHTFFEPSGSYPGLHDFAIAPQQYGSHYPTPQQLPKIHSQTSLPPVPGEEEVGVAAPYRPCARALVYAASWSYTFLTNSAGLALSS